MWKDVGKARGWKHLGAPRSSGCGNRRLQGRSWDTRIGCMVTMRSPPGEVGKDIKNEEDGPGPP